MKSKPVDISLHELMQPDIVEYHHNRFIFEEFGIVNSFSSLKSNIKLSKQPYRIKEGRIIRCLSGEGRIMINLREYELKENTLLIIPPESIIQLIEATEEYDFQMLAVQLNFLSIMQKEDLINIYSRQCTLLHLNEEECDLINQYFLLLWDITQAATFQREAIQHLLSSLLYTVQYTTKKHINESETKLNRQVDIFHRFIDLVNQHSKTERNVAFYADKLCLTPRYLNTVIKQSSQQTIMEWINQSVILEAQIRLKYSNLMIYEIAEELSFANPSFFCKFFKKMTGMTPLEYQKK